MKSEENDEPVAQKPQQQQQRHAEAAYTICLSWSGGRQKLHIPREMTWKDFCDTAAGIVSGSSQLLELRTGYPLRRIIVEDYDTLLLVRTLIPHNTLVHCSIKKDETAASCTTTSQKKRKLDDAQVVDLTNDEDDSNGENDVVTQQQKSDEALARRLQAEQVYSFQASSSMNGGTGPRDDNRNPTEVTHTDYFIFQHGCHRHQHSSTEPILGKWLVFAGEDNIAEVWNKVRRAIHSGDLAAPQAKVSTRYNNMQQHYGKRYCMCVYTTRSAMHEVGMQLIRLVRVDSIGYKTDEATAQGRYRVNGDRNICIAHLYWNNGRPGSVKRARLWTAKKSTREAKAAAEGSPPLTQRFHDRIVTVTGLNHSLAAASTTPIMEEGVTKFRLVREPDNQHDSNAIRIDNSMGEKIGFVTAKHALVLAPWLDRGLVEIETLTLLHKVSDASVITLKIEGRACADATAMLECF